MGAGVVNLEGEASFTLLENTQTKTNDSIYSSSNPAAWNGEKLFLRRKSRFGASEQVKNAGFCYFVSLSFCQNRFELKHGVEVDILAGISSCAVSICWEPFSSLRRVSIAH